MKTFLKLSASIGFIFFAAQQTQAQSISCAGQMPSQERLILINGDLNIDGELKVTEKVALGKKLPAFKTVRQAHFQIQDISEEAQGVVLTAVAKDLFVIGAQSLEIKLFVPHDLSIPSQLSTRFGIENSKQKQVSVNCQINNDGGLELERGDLIMPLSSVIDRPGKPRPIRLEY
jgi:hypothetical protein